MALNFVEGIYYRCQQLQPVVKQIEEEYGVNADLEIKT